MPTAKLASDDHSMRCRRYKKLRVDWFKQCEIQVAGADQFAEFFRIGHKERLDDTIDEHRRRQEYEELVLAPA